MRTLLAGLLLAAYAAIPVQAQINGKYDKYGQVIAAEKTVTLVDKAQVKHALQALKNAKPYGDKIVVVNIDERSVIRNGPMRWSRDKVGKTIDNLAACKPSAILSSIYFPDEFAGTKELEQSLMAAKRAGIPVILFSGSRLGEPTLKPLVDASWRTGHADNALPGAFSVFNYAPDLKSFESEFTASAYAASAILKTNFSIEGTRISFGGKSISDCTKHVSGSCMSRFTLYKSFREISADEALNHTIQCEVVAGKPVVIGATYKGEGVLVGDAAYKIKGKVYRLKGLYITASILQSFLDGDVGAYP